MSAKLSLIIIILPFVIALLTAPTLASFSSIHGTRKIGKHGYIHEESKMAMRSHGSPPCRCGSYDPSQENSVSASGVPYKGKTNGRPCRCPPYVNGNRGGPRRPYYGRGGRNGK